MRNEGRIKEVVATELREAGMKESIKELWSRDSRDIGLRHNESKLSLSKRERQILILVARGFSDKEISKKLFITNRTASNHFTHILKKLNAKNRVQAVIEAIKHDLLTLAEI